MKVKIDKNKINYLLETAIPKQQLSLVDVFNPNTVVDKTDEKRLVKDLGGPHRYIANNKFAYGLLGSVGGLSAGVKGAMLWNPGSTYLPDPNNESHLDELGDLAGMGALAMGGAYLGKRFGNYFGEKKSIETLKKLQGNK